jgi:hypothetical protein
MRPSTSALITTQSTLGWLLYQEAQIPTKQVYNIMEDYS